jgi:ubiquinone/menaquinone biosynthesis C-methylase UbiE
MQFISKNKRFLDPSEILPYAGIQKDAVVADFGCGNGFYPVAAGQLVGENGTVYAVDIQNEPLEATMSAARHSGLKNIYTIRHDMEQPGTPIKDQTCDAVILSGILHLAHLQKNILRESYRVLKSGGKVVIIEWKKKLLPFGPKISTRISEQELETMMTATGFTFKSEIPADYFHYALVFTK